MKPRVGFSYAIIAALAAWPSEPGTALTRVRPTGPNTTFLMNTKVRSVEDWSSPDEPIPMLSRTEANRLKREYMQIHEEYERRAYHGTLDPRFHTRQYFNRLTNFSQMMFRSVIDFQINQRIERAERKSNKIRVFRAVQKTVENVVNGQLNYDAGPKFKIGTESNLPQAFGRVWFQSFIVDGQVTVRLANAWENDDQRAQRLAAGGRNEMLSLSLSRSLGFWGLSSGATFWAESTMMQGTVSKAFSRHFRAIYSAEAALVPGPYSAPLLQRLSFVYSGQF